MNTWHCTILQYTGKGRGLSSLSLLDYVDKKISGESFRKTKVNKWRNLQDCRKSVEVHRGMIRPQFHFHIGELRVWLGPWLVVGCPYPAMPPTPKNVIPAIC